MVADTPPGGKSSPAEIIAGRRIGTGVLVRHDGGYVGDVDWFGFPIGVRIVRQGDGVLCEFFDRPKPDWAAVPILDDRE